MKTPKTWAASAAFTRADLGTTLAVIGLLAAISWSAMAGSAGRSARVLCLNNLRQIGGAFQIWAHDHDQENLWRVPVNDGGTQGSSLMGSAWFHFSWVSNHLVTPRILVCPQDLTRFPADNWGFAANGGFLNVAYRNNSISYPLGMHTSGLVPQSLLCSDRNIRFTGLGTCGVGLNNAWEMSRGNGTVAWTNAIHGTTGNLLLNDGQVVEASTARLREQLNVPSGGGESGIFKPEAAGIFHLVTP